MLKPEDSEDYQNIQNSGSSWTYLDISRVTTKDVQNPSLAKLE